MKTIAIIDDDASTAETVCYAVEDAGLQPWLFPGKSDSVEIAVQEIIAHADAAICDHRLSTLGFANYYGAELVADLIKHKVPAILISQFVSQDYDVSIRRWRAAFPSLLCRDECRPDTIRDALELCRREMSGEILPGRRKHRTLLRVADLQNEGGETVIDAIVPAWNRQKAVRFPVSMLPADLRQDLQKGLYIIAYVNLAATRPEDLFFEGFERPKPIE